MCSAPPGTPNWALAARQHPARQGRGRYGGAVQPPTARLGAALRARTDAAAGDHVQSRAALERAHRHMGAVSEPPSGTEFFDAPRLDRMAGTTYLLMTDTHRAVPLLTQARDRRAPADAKGRALVTLDLADCHAVDHEPEDAVRLAVHALAAVDGSMVGPILTRARTLCSGLDRWSDLPTVRELDARLVVPPRG